MPHPNHTIPGMPLSADQVLHTAGADMSLRCVGDILFMQAPSLLIEDRVSRDKGLRN